MSDDFFMKSDDDFWSEAYNKKDAVTEWVLDYLREEDLKSWGVKGLLILTDILINALMNKVNVSEVIELTKIKGVINELMEMNK